LPLELAPPVPLLASFTTWPFEAGGKPAAIFGKLLDRAAWVTANSARLRDTLVALAPAILPRSAVVYSGNPWPDRDPEPLPCDPPVLLCIGRMLETKGFDLAIRALAPLTVNLLTVHASGGPAMLRAAAEAAASLACPPRLLAVTVLTSMDAQQLEAIGVPGSPQEQVLRLAKQAWKAGVTGLVASPQEAAMLRREFGSGLHLVTPGIRAASARGGDDQQRVATPRAALLAGASQLVIGRPVTRAADPAAAYDALLAEIARPGDDTGSPA